MMISGNLELDIAVMEAGMNYQRDTRRSPHARWIGKNACLFPVDDSLKNPRVGLAELNFRDFSTVRQLPHPACIRSSTTAWSSTL